jgi:hypothetical protein
MDYDIVHHGPPVLVVVVVVVGAAVVVVVVQMVAPGIQSVVQLGSISPSTHCRDVTTSIDKIAPPPPPPDRITMYTGLP